MHVDLTRLPPVFLTSEAALEGLDPRRLKVAMERKLVLRPGRGLCVDAGRWPDPVERHVLLAHAAVRAVDGCALSHVSAALALGLPNPRGVLPRPSVTVDDQLRSRSPGSWMTLYRGELPPGHVEPLTGCATPWLRGPWSAAAFHRMGLPRWVPQVNVHDAHDRFLGRVDGYWPDLGGDRGGRRSGQVPGGRRPGHRPEPGCRGPKRPGGRRA